MTHKKSILYFLVLLFAAGVVITALGGGLFGQTAPWFLQWQYQAFAGLCHQIPGRSFWIAGQPMAVCSRCFGIYSGFLWGWIMLPVLSRISTGWPVRQKTMLLTAVAVNCIDVAGNMFGLWHNTLISRYILGLFLGTTAAILFLGIFFSGVWQKAVSVSINSKGIHG